MLAVMFHNCPEICLFIFGVKDLYEVLGGLKCALRFFGCLLIDAITHHQDFSILAHVLNLMMSLIDGKMSSSVISFVRKSKTIPNSFMMLLPRMKSNPGLIMTFM